jgi:hypothetical protein
MNTHERVSRDADVIAARARGLSWREVSRRFDISDRHCRRMWPERYAGKWGARVKDKLERYLHDRVCDGTVRLSKARRAFRNWKASFKRFGL